MRISMFFVLLWVPSIVWSQSTPSQEEAIQLEYQKRIAKTHINGVYIPSDFSNAIEILDEIIEEDGKLKFGQQPEEFAVNNVFFSFGRWLLINWGIEQGSRLTVALNKQGLTFPDDMVRAIMIGYHRTLNHLPVHMDELVKHVIEYRQEREKKEKGS